MGQTTYTTFHSGKDKHYCDSVVGDCRHIPACDANANCKFDRTFGSLNLFQCVCKNGYSGNGIQCMDKKGVIGKNPEKIVTVEMEFTIDYFERNNQAFKFPFGAQKNIFKEMEKVEKMCQKDECKAKYKQIMKNKF